MKKHYFFTLIIAAAIFCTPATALARGGPRFSFSLNLFDCLPFFAPPPPIVEPVFVPCYPCYPPPVCVERRTVVKEYHHHYYCECPRCCEEIEIHHPQPQVYHHRYSR